MPDPKLVYRMMLVTIIVVILSAAAVGYIGWQTRRADQEQTRARSAERTEQLQFLCEKVNRLEEGTEAAAIILGGRSPQLPDALSKLRGARCSPDDFVLGGP